MFMSPAFGDVPERFMSSSVEFHLGGILLLIYFLYPVFLIIFNKIIKWKENKMDKAKHNELLKRYNEYYKNL